MKLITFMAEVLAYFSPSKLGFEMVHQNEKGGISGYDNGPQPTISRKISSALKRRDVPNAQHLSHVLVTRESYLYFKQQLFILHFIFYSK